MAGPKALKNLVGLSSGSFAPLASRCVSVSCGRLLCRRLLRMDRRRQSQDEAKPPTRPARANQCFLRMRAFLSCSVRTQFLLRHDRAGLELAPQSRSGTVRSIGHAVPACGRRCIARQSGGQTTCRRQWASSRLGKSPRKWTPRDSSRCRADADHQPGDGEQVLQLPAGARGRTRGAGRSGTRRPRRAPPPASPARSRTMPILRTIRLRSELVRSATSRRPGVVRLEVGRAPAAPRRCRASPRPPRPRARPQAAPNTSPSSRLFDASRLAPCRPLDVTSPAAHRPGSVVRPCGVHRDAADHVVGARPDRDGVARDVEAEPPAHLVDAGEALHAPWPGRGATGRGRRWGAASAPCSGRWPGPPRRAGPARPAGPRRA